MLGYLLPCLDWCMMDISLFSLPSSCLYPSPSVIETSFHHAHVHSYYLCFYLYGSSSSPTSIFVAAAVKQRRKNQVKRGRGVSASANAYVNQSQFTQTAIHKRGSAFLSNDTIRGYVKNGLWAKALRMYYQMQRAGMDVDKVVFISAINACGSLSDLQAGRKIHDDIVARGFELDVFVGTALVSMYVKCGNLENGRQVFDRMSKRDVVSWNVIIAGYTQNGQPGESLTLFNDMQVQGIKPNSVTIVGVLHACTQFLALKQGKQIHSYAIKNGIESNVIVATELLNMYVKCGNLTIANELFERMHKQDVVSWNAIIAGYSQNGNHYEALAYFNEMQVQGIKPNLVTIVSVLPACAHLLALEQGRQIHGYAIKSGFESNILLGTGLVNLYGKCGNVNIAQKLFERLPKQDVASWTTIIASYSQSDKPYQAFTFFIEMQARGIKPNSITIVSVLRACSNLMAVDKVKQIHGYALRSGFESDIVVATGLVDTYAKCGNVNIGHRLFERMPEKDVASWTAIIAGYSQSDHPHEALAFFIKMQVQGIKPNSITMVSVLPACANLMALEEGKQIHGYVMRSGFEYDVIVGTGLVSMYAKCGSVNTACKLFKRMPQRNVVSWNAIIAGYSQNGRSSEALAFFNEMQAQGIKPNPVTIASVLPACGSSLALEQGKQIHGYVIRTGFESNVVVSTGLVDMYAKCGNVKIACNLFERMPQKNVVSWTAIIAGCSQNGHSREALAFFNEMVVQRIKPNSITMASILPACADSLALEQGKQIHNYVIRNGFESNVIVVTGLVDMYAKCGHIGIARQVFDKMSSRNVASWNAMILGYSFHGHGEDALALFSQMQQAGTKADNITFVGVLTACSHAGLVDEGWRYFKSMKSDYGIVPEQKHYTCLADLLGLYR